MVLMHEWGLYAGIYGSIEPLDDDATLAEIANNLPGMEKLDENYSYWCSHSEKMGQTKLDRFVPPGENSMKH
uniref:Uncharacterized protein n=1 Tax=Romanomermis culicivorax TaxID=13658 RepID=A0A915HER6_ROMCU